MQVVAAPPAWAGIIRPRHAQTPFARQGYPTFHWLGPPAFTNNGRHDVGKPAGDMSWPEEAD